MKKLFYLTMLVAVLGFLILGCAKSPNPAEATLTEQSELAKQLHHPINIANLSKLAKASTAEFSYFIFDIPGFPIVSMAANGQTVQMAGEGTFSVFPKSVDGGGTFTEKDESGNVLSSGTWAATKLLSYTSYGELTFDGVTVAGGKLRMQVQLSTGEQAVLWVDCLIGDPTPNAAEGIRLAVQGGPNYNKEVSGITLYVRNN
ncbi:MAG: hypothetical protein ACREBU_17665 [Nitrososphaera sp.]